jgi:hypothetical protein
LSSVSSLPFLPSFLTSSPYYNTIFEHTQFTLEVEELGLKEASKFGLDVVGRGSL